MHFMLQLEFRMIYNISLRLSRRQVNPTQLMQILHDYTQSYRHQICDFEMRVNEMLAIVVLYYN